MAETNNGPLHILMKRNSNLKAIIDTKKLPTPEISLFRSEPKSNSKEKPRKTSSLINSYIPQISNDFVHKYSCINLILPDSDDIFFDIKNLLEYFMQFEFLNQAKSSNKTFLAKIYGIYRFQWYGEEDRFETIMIMRNIAGKNLNKF